MKKAVYRLILFAAITVFVLSLSPTVMAESNDTQTKQNQCIASDTKTLPNADKQEAAPHQKSAVSKENSQLQLAKEQLRGDFYKDSQDNLNSALNTLFTITIAVILSAFGVIAYFIFKDKRDYKDAVEAAKEAARDAKESAKNAHDLEKEAQQVLGDIKKQAKTTVEEIEKTSKKQREESSSEFERQRKISELFSRALMASRTKDHETAADCYRQIVEEQKEENESSVYNNWGVALRRLAKLKKGTEAEELLKQAFEKYQKAIEIKQDFCESYYGWGCALSGLARLKKGTEAVELFKQAIEKCKKTVEIKPNYFEAYDGWGAALTELAKSKKGTEAEKLFNQAIEKYKKAIEIKPDHFEAYNNWGATLIYLAKLKGGKDAEDLLEQTEEKCLKAESIKPGVSAYNLACVYALRGNEVKCQEWLKVGEKAETLDTREYAMADDDLKSVRDKDWFKKLRWEGE